MMQETRKSALILAAGIGSRLKELTISKPKALIEINGKTLLEIVINNLIINGFNHIVINVHHHANQIIDFVSIHNFFGIEIEISDESDMLLDTGGALLKALPLFSQSEIVLVHNVDIVSNINLKVVFKSFQNDKSDALLLCRNRESSRKFICSKDHTLIGWRNKITGEKKMIKGQANDYQEFSFSGIYFIRPQILSNFKIEKCSIIDIFLKLAENHCIKCEVDDDGYWFDLGKKEDLKQISQMITTL